MKMTWLVLICLLGANAFAKNHAVLIGGTGGSSDDGEESIFKPNVSGLDSLLRQKDWDTQVLFADEDGTIDNSRASSNENILTALDRAAGECHAGEEVLVYFQGHGAPNQDQLTHSFSSINGSHFNMDDVQPAFKKMAARGCKSALIDLSCFSGMTQNLGTTIPNTCLVTLASKNYVSVCADLRNSGQFANGLIASITDQTNGLQAHFRKARSGDNTETNLPEISTLPVPAAEAWDTYLKDTDPFSINRDPVAPLEGIDYSDPSHYAEDINKDRTAIKGLIDALESKYDGVAPKLDVLTQIMKDYGSSLEALEKAKLNAWNEVGFVTTDMLRDPEVRQSKIKQYYQFKKVLFPLETEVRGRGIAIMTMEREIFEQYYNRQKLSPNVCTDFRL